MQDFSRGKLRRGGSLSLKAEAKKQKPSSVKYYLQIVTVVDNKDGPMSWGHLKENQENEVSLLAKSQTISVETDL